MNNNFDPLSAGLSQLCRDNPAVDRLISPRAEEILSLLANYIVEIETHNPALSLVGTNDRQELIVRHILDSLAPLGVLIECVSRCVGTKSTIVRIADVGSGAGLPGIPLAIVMPDAEFTLIERKGRRAGFLRTACETLNLAHVSVEEEEMEKVKPGRFTLVTFRAFRPLEPPVCKKLFRLCAEGASLAAYKGRREKTLAEITALQEARQDISGRWKLVPCPVPFLNEERHMLCIQSGSFSL